MIIFKNMIYIFFFTFHIFCLSLSFAPEIMIFDLSEEPEEEEDSSFTHETVISSFTNNTESEFSLSQTETISYDHVESPTTPKTKTQRKKRKSKSSPLSQVDATTKAMKRAEQQAQAEIKEMIKQTKAQEKIIELQKHGYYKTQEITLVLPEELYNSTLGAAISSHIMFATENDKSYACMSATSSVVGLCRWTFRNYLDGGNAIVGVAGSVVIPFVVVVFSPRVFLELVEASPDGEEFPLLEEAMRTLRTQMETQEQCPVGSKLVLVLIDIEEERKQYKKVRSLCQWL